MSRLADIDLPEGVKLDTLVDLLRDAGAVFGYLHGSRVNGSFGPTSDLDVAAWFGRAVPSWTVVVAPAVDLLVLDSAGLELAGRVANRGVLLFDDDPPLRVHWQADTTKRYLEQAHRRRRLVDTVLRRG